MKLLQSCVGNYLFHISLEFKRRRETTDSCLSFWGRVQSSPHSTVGDRRQLNTNSRTSETTNIWRQCWGGSRNVQRGRKEGDVKFKYVWVFILGSNNKTLTKADSFERLLRGHWFVSNMGPRNRRNKCSDDSPVSPLALYSAKSIALYALCMKKARIQRKEISSDIWKVLWIQKSSIGYGRLRKAQGTKSTNGERVLHCKMLCSGLSLTKLKGFRNVASVRL